MASPAAAGARPRASLFGCELDRLDMEQAVARCLEAVAEGRYLQHIAINVAKIVSLQDDPQMRAMVKECGLITADGQGVVWATRILGDPVPGRVAGIDLMDRLLEEAARRGLKVFILGARQEVLSKAVTRLRDRHPGLIVAGHRNGYFSDREVPEVCEEIRRSRADLLFVAISSPRKELFLGEHGPSLGTPFVMGVGGAIDVVAGVALRAPATLQWMGLEWLFRLVQEPRRLWRRYLFTNLRFSALVARRLLSRGRARA